MNPSEQTPTKLASPLRKPVMVFDGDCGFCRAWIARWRVLTGDAVDYMPYQQDAWRFPDLTKEQFSDEVHLIDQKGRVSRGAEAVFRALAYAPRRRWLLRLYETAPSFARMAESMYRFVARHRGPTSFMTRLLYGEHTEPPTYKMASYWFLRVMGVIYLIAFVSLWTQLKGLIGEKGVMPAGALLEQLSPRLAGMDKFWAVPTLCWLDTSDWFQHFLCGAGTTAAFMLMSGILPAFACVVLWVCYLSLTTVSGVFLGFQWDNLLLEAGFLAIFMAPLRFHSRLADDPHPPRLSVFLVRFLLFKLMFSSGYVKLASGDPTWHDLTALTFHYWTQPLPTWTAWYANLLPLWAQKASCGIMFAIELVTPFFFWAPRRIRHFAAICQITLQLAIIATGNFCFFNYLTLALCLSLLDDSFFRDTENVMWDHLHGRNWPLAARVPIAVVIVTLSSMLMTDMLQWPVPWPSSVVRMQKTLYPFRSVNSYGLFAAMTKSRAEIVVEGSDDGATWKPYEFTWKPGALDRAPRFVAPHQPRLDWQMWFAALGTYQRNPWFMNFLVRLLQGSPDVLRLMEYNPFPEGPPVSVRAQLYEYHFTTPEERTKTGDWWRREAKGLYCPPIRLSQE